jgi:hypothetical protein
MRARHQAALVTVRVECETSATTLLPDGVASLDEDVIVRCIHKVDLGVIAERPVKCAIHISWKLTSRHVPSWDVGAWRRSESDRLRS